MSAISGPAQENVDFYAGVLGLRLVKLTVNFDDPGAYHLYYGDGIGTPGTLLTFFPYPEGQPGRPGAGQATVTHLSIPPGSTGFWTERFRRFEVDFDRPYTRENRETTRFRGPDGLLLELIASPEHVVTEEWSEAQIPRKMAIGGIVAMTIVARELGPTKRVLEEVLGFRLKSEKHGRFRFGVDDGGSGKVVEIVVDPDGLSGRQGHGTVHHFAFRAPSTESQAMIREKAIHLGLRPSEVRDRDYFKSVYFREPGGVLFEVATDKPGFTVDERPEELGTCLKLPKQFEGSRPQIKRALPKLVLPNAN